MKATSVRDLLKRLGAHLRHDAPGEVVPVPGLPREPGAYHRTRVRMDGDTGRLLDAERTDR